MTTVSRLVAEFPSPANVRRSRDMASRAQWSSLPLSEPSYMDEVRTEQRDAVNAAVAERVMGWRRQSWAAQRINGRSHLTPPDGDDSMTRSVDDYAGEIFYAFQVVGAMAVNGFRFDLRQESPNEWRVMVTHETSTMDDDPHALIHGELPAAICEASLEALDVAKGSRWTTDATATPLSGEDSNG